MTRLGSCLVIDARPRGPSGPLAAETILGRPVLLRLIEAAGATGQPRVTIHARPEEFSRLDDLASGSHGVDCRFAPGPPPAGAVILRSDRLYDHARLRRAIRRGSDPEVAVLWRIDTPGALAAAGEELIRRSTYQPLGRFWALGPARWLARRLAPTRIRPNMVTACAGALMLLAAATIAIDATSPTARLAASMALALALVLDTADGHLARLQGTASRFGRWFDANLDELADLALHAAIAWSLSEGGHRPGWLLLGLLYASGKYLFHFGNTSWSDGPPSSATDHAEPAPVSRLRSLALWAGHADIRWHLWIVLAALGGLGIELAAYAAYYPLRAAAGAWRKGARHG
jgi:phosphatidylserine synthase